MGATEPGIDSRRQRAYNSATTMDTKRLERLLAQVRSGEIEIDEAMRRLRTLPFADLGFAKLDHHRRLRTGYPEVVFCQGKTEEQALRVIARLAEHSPRVLATRATMELVEAVRRQRPDARYYDQARIIAIGEETAPEERVGGVLVITAGTADIPVAEEAAVTAELLGSRTERLYDVGVAGIHRLLSHQEKIEAARVIIVVAGMEGALASVVGGLVEQPVIAVPTSVGYGASFGGLAALLSMLNTCAAGVAVVNIDNGFGAGYFANLINKGWRSHPD